MKRIFHTFTVMSGISALFFLSSCSSPSSDTTPASNDVTVSVSVKANGVTIANNATVFPDDSISVVITCTGNAQNNLSRIKVTSTYQTASIIDTTLTGTSATQSFWWPVQTTTGAVVYTIKVTGVTGNPATATFTLNVADIANYSPVLGNQTDGVGELFSTSLDSVYSMTDIYTNPSKQSAIDIMYCSTSDSMNMLLSPSSARATLAYGTNWGSHPGEQITNWSVRNITRFKLANVTQAQFLAATTKSKQNALISSAKAALGEPTAGSVGIYDTQVYLFKTQAGKYGLVLVSNPTGTVTGTSIAPGQVQLLIIMYY